MESRNSKISGWSALLSLVAFGIYAFVLSIVGGILVWISLQLGQTYEVGIGAVLVFFLLELALFFSARRSPAVKVTNLILRPIIYLARQLVRGLPCALSKSIERDVMRQLVNGTSKLWD